MKIHLCLLLTAVASFACAQTLAPELGPIAAKYKADIATLEAQRAAALAQAQNPYVTALGVAEKTATTSGNLAAVSMITTERATLNSGLMAPGFPPGMPKELQNPRKTYLDGLARIRTVEAPRRQAIDAAYLRALTSLNARAAKDPELSMQLEAEKQKLLAGASVTSGSKPNSKSAVINGSFDLADENGHARGWVMNRADDFKVVHDGTNSVLHASNKTLAYGSVTQEILVPAKARSVTLSGRIRGKLETRKPGQTDFGPRLTAVYLDAQGVRTKNWIFWPSEINAEWKNLSQTQKVPDGMKSLQVILEVTNAAGEFDFDEIAVEFR